jgi:GTP pyrophosphokinase
MDSISQTIAPLDKPSYYDGKRQQRLINEIMELLVTHHGGSLSENALDESIDALQKAINLAQEAHSIQVRKSGEPYFFHPLRVAHMAARHWMDFARS